MLSIVCKNIYSSQGLKDVFRIYISRYGNKMQEKIRLKRIYDFVVLFSGTIPPSLKYEDLAHILNAKKFINSNVTEY